MNASTLKIAGLCLIVGFLAYRSGQAAAQSMAAPAGSAQNPISSLAEWWTFAGMWGA